MNWINPADKLPTPGKIYLVIFENNPNHVIALALCRYARDCQTGKERSDAIVFQSLHDPQRIKGLILGTDKKIGYAERHSNVVNRFNSFIAYLDPNELPLPEFKHICKCDCKKESK